MAVAALVLIGPAVPSVGAPSQTLGAPSPTVNSRPVSFTPWLLASTPDQYVYEIDRCGSRMYAVGRISAIGKGTNTFSRGNAFSFSAKTGAVSRWNPRANGPIRSIAFSNNCSVAYLGGEFTTIKGQTARHIVKVDTRTGTIKKGFKRNAGADVNVVELERGNVIVGGTFSTINGANRLRLASLDPGDGDPTSYLRLAVNGGRVWNSQVSHDGRRMLVEGAFSSVGNTTRHQIFMLNLGQARATLSNWYSSEFNQECIIDFYLRDAAWSPNDSKVYIATTGGWPAGDPGGPRRELCDAAAAFPSTGGTVNHTWIDYTGCDSLYAVEASSKTVYIGGHERWANNRNGCDSAGPGALARPGIAALNAGNGDVRSWNPTRALGYGADDMLVTKAGLWVASDNFSNGQAQKCGGLPKHGGICFFRN